MKKVSIVLMGIFLILGIARAGEVVGMVTDITGTVTVTRGSENLKAEVGTELYSGDVVKSGENSKADILMSNGDMMIVEENS